MNGDDIKVTKAVICDAGFASRFLPVTKAIPKGMLAIDNYPVVQFSVEECVQAGIDDIIIVTTPEGKPIYNDYFNNSVTHVRKQLRAQGKLDRYDQVQHVLDFPRVRIVVQGPEWPYGNGSPVGAIQSYIAPGEAFVVIFADDVVFGASDVKTLIESYERHPDAKAIIMGQEVDPSVIDKYGIITTKNLTGDNGQIEGRLLDTIIEKPEVGSIDSTLASYGRYLLTSEVFQHLEITDTGKDGELWLTTAIDRLRDSGSVYVEQSKGKWVTTGDPHNLFMASLHYTLQNHPDYMDEIRQMIDEFSPSK